MAHQTPRTARPVDFGSLLQLPKSLSVRKTSEVAEDFGSRPAANRGALVLLAGVLALAAAGCSGPSTDTTIIEIGGYTNRSLYRDDVRTVAVPIFTVSRAEFRRGLEFQLTEALIKQIETRTPYKVVPIERADTVIEGTVLGLSQSVLTETPKNKPREVQVTITVRVAWRDLRSGITLNEAEHLSENATFVVDVGETVATATGNSFDDLVERIVELMESDF